MKTEELILLNLSRNEPFFRKVIPYFKSEYLQDSHEKALFEAIKAYSDKYNALPSKAALELEVASNKNLNQSELNACGLLINNIYTAENDHQFEWLVDTTEAFCQEKAVYNAIMSSIQILDGTDQKRAKGSIPELLTDALSVSFDPQVGHNYFADADYRYDFHHRVDARIPFDLKDFNEMTNGGLKRKTLNIVLGGTNVGKTLILCHMAASFISQGFKVLYITLEMSQESIAERIDANLMNIELDVLAKLSKDMYQKKIARVKERVTGDLFIKEYPTGSAGSAHFRALVNELALKKKFVPDVVIVDYLNICTSSRLKMGSNINSYTFVKAIAEELRGLGVEKDVAVFSATQTTRSGFTNSDPGLEDTSESFGLPATADLMFAVVSTPELAAMNQYLIKQLKNRYADLNKKRKFMIGVNRAKMRLYELEDSAQVDLVDDAPQPAVTNSMSNLKPGIVRHPTGFDPNEKFKGFKV